MNSVNLLQTLELIWQKKFQMHESGLILVLPKFTSTESQPLSINELKDAFSRNKSPGHNGVRFNCVLM